MVSLLAGWLAVCLLLGVPKTVHSEPDDPCDIGELSLALESENVREECGSELVLESVQSEPIFIRYDNADESKKYAVLMVDPDAPNSTVADDKYFLHWLLESVPGVELKSGEFRTEEDESPPYLERMSYTAPNPPKGSGPHRYQFFVYEQPNASLLGVPDKARSGFGVDAFAAANSLGSPVAAFEFVAENIPAEDL